MRRRRRRDGSPVILRQRERRMRSGSGSGDCLRRATAIGESNSGSTTGAPSTSNGPGRLCAVEDARGIRSRPERTSTTIIVIGIAITAQANALCATTPSESSPRRPTACSMRISHVLGSRSSGATAATASATRDWCSNQRAVHSGKSAMCETFCVAARSPLRRPAVQQELPSRGLANGRRLHTPRVWERTARGPSRRLRAELPARRPDDTGRTRRTRRTGATSRLPWRGRRIGGLRAAVPYRLPRAPGDRRPPGRCRAWRAVSLVGSPLCRCLSTRPQRRS